MLELKKLDQEIYAQHDYWSTESQLSIYTILYPTA